MTAIQPTNSEAMNPYTTRFLFTVLSY